MGAHFSDCRQSRGSPFRSVANLLAVMRSCPVAGLVFGAIVTSNERPPAAAPIPKGYACSAEVIIFAARMETFREHAPWQNCVPGGHRTSEAALARHFAALELNSGPTHFRG